MQQMLVSIEILFYEHNSQPNFIDAVFMLF
jgi:hypothetical protein